MKAEQILKEVSEKHEHRMADMPYNSNLTMVLDAMETYADQKQNDIDELVEALRIATNFDIDSGTIEEYNLLIQKHTK